MIIHSSLRFLILPFLTAFLFVYASPTYCVPPQQLSPSFCNRPPVVADFDLEQYAGKWYQIYTAADATPVSTNRCVTANYTLLEDGMVNVLNCQLPESENRPQCQRALAERRVGEQPPHLQVQFAPFLPAGPYNIAALLGDAESGYEAAAVYSCTVSESGFSEGIFVIARSPKRPEYVIEKLSEHLRCVGYPLKESFVSSYLGDDCKFFYDGDGIVEVNMFEPDESDAESVEKTI